MRRRTSSQQPDGHIPDEALTDEQQASRRVLGSMSVIDLALAEVESWSAVQAAGASEPDKQATPNIIDLPRTAPRQ